MPTANRRDRATALLLDLDGVVRRYDPALIAPAERRYGLAPGTVLRTALEPARLVPAITGKVTRAEWLTGVAEALADAAGGAEAARSLVVEWNTYRGTVVPQVVAFVRESRQSGVAVALATNATDDLDADLAALGLSGEFDAVVGSASLGVPKPDPRFFAAACDAVGTPADRCLFVDDDERNVRGARAAGLSAFRFTRLDDLTYLRAALSR